jgi:hypothetical protein
VERPPEAAVESPPQGIVKWTDILGKSHDNFPTTQLNAE